MNYILITIIMLVFVIGYLSSELKKESQFVIHVNGLQMAEACTIQEALRIFANITKKDETAIVTIVNAESGEVVLSNNQKFKR